MVFKMKLIYHGIAEILDANHIGAKTVGYTLRQEYTKVVI